MESSEAVTRTKNASVSGVVFWPDRRVATGFSYQVLHWVELTEDGAVVCHFGEHLVTVKGSGLEDLPCDLLLHRVLSVRLSIRADAMEDSATGEIVEGIVIRTTAPGRGGPE